MLNLRSYQTMSAVDQLGIATALHKTVGISSMLQEHGEDETNHNNV